MFAHTNRSTKGIETTVLCLLVFSAGPAACFTDAFGPDPLYHSGGIIIDSTTDFPDTNDLVGPYRISTHVMSPDGIANVYLYHRSEEESTYTIDEMLQAGGGMFRLDLQGFGRGGGAVDYFIHAVDSAFYVKRDPENAPLDTYDFRIYYVPDFFPPDSVSGLESFYTGAGFSHQWEDADGDGDPDLYLSLPSQDEPNRFYRNEGSGDFTDVSEFTGTTLPGRESVGTAFGDFDNDGLPDLAVIVSISHPFLFRNVGDLVFEEVSEQAGIADGMISPTSVQWTDADLDGCLDLLITAGDGVFLYRNTGSSTFLNESELRGLPFDNGGFRSAAAFDADGDGDSEMLLLGQQSRFYRNDGGWFSDVSSPSGLTADTRRAAVFDVDGDGDLDVLMCGESVKLHENNGAGVFTNVSEEYGLSEVEGSGPVVGDLNADGRTDLGLSIGDLFVLEASGVFRDVTPFNGIDRVASFADVDGRVDIFTWMNLLRMGAGFPGGLVNRWLEVDLTGTVSNRSAVGAVAVLYAGNLVATDAVSGASPDAGTLYFGLEDESPDSLMIRWPSGIVQVERDVPYNSLIEIEEDSTLVSVGDPFVSGKLPVPFTFYQNYPNPFNPQTVLAFDLPEGSVSNQHVNLTVYDLRGRQVRTLVDEPLGPGRYKITWDGRDEAGRPVGSGVYMCRMTSEGKSTVRKMIVQK